LRKNFVFHTLSRGKFAKLQKKNEKVKYIFDLGHKIRINKYFYFFFNVVNLFFTTLKKKFFTIIVLPTDRFPFQEKTSPNERFCEIAGVARPKKMCNFAAEVARPKQSLARYLAKPLPRYMPPVRTTTEKCSERQ